MEDPPHASASAIKVADDEEQHIPYFHLSQGQGGIYTLPFYNHNGVEVECIGTHSCWTCVCVYVRLDAKSCFAAHIDGHTRAMRPEYEWITEGEEQRVSLEAFVAAELQNRLPEPFKNKSAAEEEEIQNSIVIVCPRRKVAEPKTGEEVDATGSAIISTIREHFGLSPTSEPQELAHGFVVNHKTQKVDRLVWDEVFQPTTSTFLDLERAYSTPEAKRTVEDLHLIEDHPVMLPPESKGFFEVPGRAWTLVYDYETDDWRKMKLVDFSPFYPSKQTTKCKYKTKTKTSDEGDANGGVLTDLPKPADKQGRITHEEAASGNASAVATVTIGLSKPAERQAHEATRLLAVMGVSATALAFAATTVGVAIGIAIGMRHSRT